MIFTFNLIVGTGALAIPKAFQDAGYVLGLIILALLAFFRFGNYFILSLIVLAKYFFATLSNF